MGRLNEKGIVYNDGSNDYYSVCFAYDRYRCFVCKLMNFL